jgi:hypothetical protein
MAANKLAFHYEYAAGLTWEEATEAPLTEDGTGQITALLQHWIRGDEKALGAMVPVVYKELQRLARQHLQSATGGK